MHGGASPAGNEVAVDPVVSRACGLATAYGRRVVSSAQRRYRRATHSRPEQDHDGRCDAERDQGDGGDAVRGLGKLHEAVHHLTRFRRPSHRMIPARRGVPIALQTR